MMLSLLMKAFLEVEKTKGQEKQSLQLQGLQQPQQQRLPPQLLLQLPQQPQLQQQLLQQRFHFWMNMILKRMRMMKRMTLRSLMYRKIALL